MLVFLEERKRALAMLAGVAVVSLALVAGCGGDDGGDSSASSGDETSSKPVSEKGKGFTLGLVSAMDCTNTVTCAHQEGFEAAAESMGADVKILESPAADLINNQIKNMDQLRASGVDAAAIWVQDDQALRPPILRAIDAGIPVFTMELYEPIKGVTAQYLQGRSWQGIQSAQTICDNAPEEGGTALYGDWHLPNPGLTNLKENFAATIAECGGGNIEIKYFDNKTDDIAGGRAAAEPALQQTDDPISISGYNDPTAIGGALAAEELGKREGVYVTGYNLGEDGVQGIERGQIDASWDFRAAVTGQLMADGMVNFLAGGKDKLAPVTMIWPKCYTADTIGDLKSIDTLTEEIRGGTNLAAEEPELIDESDKPLTEPTQPVPGC